MANRKQKTPIDSWGVQNQAMILAMDGYTWKEVGQELNISTSTLWKWRNNPDFQRRLTQLQEAVFAETALRHNTYLTNGMAKLNEIAINKKDKYDQETQLKAAIALVELTHRNIEAIKVVEQNRKYLNQIEEAIDVEVEGT